MISRTQAAIFSIIGASVAICLTLIGFAFFSDIVSQPASIRTGSLHIGAILKIDGSAGSDADDPTSTTLGTSVNCDGLECNGQDQGFSDVILIPNSIHSFSYTLTNLGTTDYKNYIGDSLVAWLDTTPTPNPLRVLLYPNTINDQTIENELNAMVLGQASISPSAIANINGAVCSGIFYGQDPAISACTTSALTGTLNEIYTIGQSRTYNFKLVLYAPNGTGSYSQPKIYLGLVSGAQGINAVNWKEQVRPYVCAAIISGDAPVIYDAGKNKEPFVGQVGGSQTDTDDYLLALVIADDLEDGDLTDDVEILDYGGFDPNTAGDYIITYTVTDSDGNTTTFKLTVRVWTIVNVGTGMYGSTAVDTFGRMYVFGDNAGYRLGNNSNVAATTPKLNTYNPTEFKYIDIGVYHGLGIAQDGSLWSWGERSYGKLGDGITTDYQRTPQLVTSVPGNPTFVKVAAAIYTSFALDNDGNLWVFGSCNVNACASSATGTVTTPTKIAGLSNIVDFSIGNTALTTFGVIAVDSAGNLWSWGDNAYGRSGTGNNTPIPTAIKIYDAASGNFLTNNGSINSSAISLPPGRKMVQATIGEGVGVALDELGNVYSWGSNLLSDMGNGASGGYLWSPMQIYDASNGNFLLTSGAINAAASNPGEPRKIIDIQTSAMASSYAIDELGNLYSWGYGVVGALGANSIANRPSPIRIYNSVTGEFYGTGTGGINGESVPAGTKVIQVSTDGDAYALILTSNGIVFGIGYGALYQLGDGGTSNNLVAAPWIFVPDPVP